MVNKVDKHIAKKIRELRIEEGITQEDLAYMLGFKSRVSLANIETFKQSITSKTIYLACCIFNVMPTELFPNVNKVKIKKSASYIEKTIKVKRNFKVTGLPKI